MSFAATWIEEAEERGDWNGSELLLVDSLPMGIRITVEDKGDWCRAVCKDFSGRCVSLSHPSASREEVVTSCLEAYLDVLNNGI